MAVAGESLVTELPVDGERLREDIERNASFGSVDAEAGPARTVLPGTPANRQARSYLVNRMEAAGLEVYVDAVGNIAGTWTPPGIEESRDGERDRSRQPIAAGSHLDSVPRGGIFDGVLGVYAALESVRAIKSSDCEVVNPLTVVSFTGEEGTRFSDGVLGSSVAAGTLTVEDALNLSDGDVTLRESLDNIGFRGCGRLDSSEWDAWLEVHVEQSDALERANAPVGVVTSITGTSRCRIIIEGESDHAGTTAMANRTDALAAASEFVLAVEASAREATQADDSAVATVGSLQVSPDVVNVVPGGVELSVDVRSVNAATIERMVDDVTQKLSALERERGVSTTFERPYDISPQPMADRAQQALRRASMSVGIDAPSMQSGAGHDTMQIAAVTDAGLLFARSRGGYSHSPCEWTDWDDCTTATRVLAAALADLAGPGADQ
jgi:N-carbamoyl-L-amino-acid hydrolase